MDIYTRLETHFGPTGWWPGDTPFEVAVGAVLTQNTAWTNVEKAITRIKDSVPLEPMALYKLEEERLADLIRPAGYFRVKARRLRALLTLIVESFGGDFAALGKLPTAQLRETLLEVKGIGPETADDIVLYAFGRPVFVIDAYTRRIFGRHNIINPANGYEEIRRFFENNLERKVGLFREFHALIVFTAKEFCRKKARCDGCPLRDVTPVNPDCA